MAHIDNQFNLTEQELAAVSPEEVLHSHVDVLGIINDFARASLGKKYNDSSRTGVAAAEAADQATDEAALAALRKEIDEIPAQSKSTYLEAVERCPAMVDDAHRMAFLKKDDFDAKRAARRLVKYWDLKKDTFGPEKCFLPLTLAGALRDDLPALSSGFICLLPGKDSLGRSIIFCNVSRINQAKYSTDSLMRAVWYIWHVANEDPDDLDKGVISIETYEHARTDQIDNDMTQKSITFVTTVPFLCRAGHVCHPNNLFTRMMGVVMPFIGVFLKMRIRVHHGSQEKILRELEGYGIPRDRLPHSFGGGVEVDQNKWLLERLLQEEGSHRPLDHLTRQAFLSDNASGSASVFSAESGTCSSTDPNDRTTIQANDNGLTDQVAVLEPRAPNIVHDAAAPAQEPIQGPNQLDAAAGQDLPLLLYTEADHNHLSDQLCLVRSQIEVFAATQEDVDYRSRRGGRAHQISVGRVGLRCIHCAYLPYKDRAHSAVLFPSSLANVHQSVRNWKRHHSTNCKCIPSQIRSKLNAVEGKRQYSTRAKDYWVESCRRLNLVDAPDGDGIRFGSSPT